MAGGALCRSVQARQNSEIAGKMKKQTLVASTACQEVTLMVSPFISDTRSLKPAYPIEALFCDDNPGIA